MKITEIRCVPLEWQIPKEMQKWPSDYGLKTETHAIIVEVKTDEGITGYGEVHPGYGYTRGASHTAKALVEKELAPQIIGEDPTRPEVIWEKLYNGPRYELATTYGHSCPGMGRRGVTICAMSGIDMALWDVFAKSLNVPIYKLLGGEYRTRIPAYASGGHAPAEQAGEQAAEYVSKGFRGVKMRVGGMDAPRVVDGAVERIAATREGIGPDVGLMLDAHGSLNVSQAMQLVHAAEEYDITWFEEPVPSDNWAGMAEVRAVTDVPIATGENDFTHFDFRDMIEEGVADIFQPDLAVVGGFTAARRVAVLTQAANLQCMPHVWGSAILFAASLQWAAALANCPVFEFRQGSCPLFTELLAEPFTVDEDGCVAIPDGPGIGVEFDLADAEKRFPLSGS